MSDNMKNAFRDLTANIKGKILYMDTYIITQVFVIIQKCLYK